MKKGKAEILILLTHARIGNRRCKKSATIMLWGHLAKPGSPGNRLYWRRSVSCRSSGYNQNEMLSL